MEAFEMFVALALEGKGFVVSPAVKFPVRRQVRKESRDEFQEHGYEVDLVGARRDRLVLASVKSFFGSRGVAADDVIGTSSDERRQGLYRLLNDRVIRNGVVRAAAERFGYPESKVELRFYVGRFAGRRGGDHEQRIRRWANAKAQHAGAGPIAVIGLDELVADVRSAAERRQYRDNPALVAVKVLGEAGQLVPLDPAKGPQPARRLRVLKSNELSALTDALERPSGRRKRVQTRLLAEIASELSSRNTPAG